MESPCQRWERCSLAPTVGTDSTASNLTGPGRSLDNFYVAVGRRMEIQLGRLAEKLGKGPRMTGVRIERRRSKVSGLPPGSKKAKGTNAKVAKDCERLVKYLRSDTPSTKMQALDQITLLSVQDSYVRDALRNRGAHQTIEQLLGSYLPALIPSLLPRSHKALLSLTDTEINSVGTEIRGHLELGRNVHVGCYFAGQAEIDKLSRLKSFLNDPNRAWLALRHLDLILSQLGRRCRSCSGSVFEGGRNFCGTFPDDVEWSTLDQMIERLLLLFYDKSLSGYIDVSRHSVFWSSALYLIFRQPHRFPKSIKSDFFTWLSSQDSVEYGVDHRFAYLTYQLLGAMVPLNCFTPEACDQLDCSIFSTLYPDTAAQALLSRISCPPDVVLNRFLSKRNQFERVKNVFRSPHWMPLLDVEELDYTCARLSHYIQSEDQMIRQRAKHAFEYLLTTDIYCRSAALLALSATPFAHTHDFKILVEETRKNCIPRSKRRRMINVYRHCDDDNKLVNLQEFRLNMKEESTQYLHLAYDHAIKLRISCNGTFSSRGFYPVLAGTTATGDKAYVARPVGDARYEDCAVAITEGMRLEEVAVTFKGKGGVRKAKPLFLDVYLLRYAPEAYTQGEGEMEGVDATGPFSWQPRVPLVRYEGESDNVVMSDAEEDRASTASSDGGETTDEEWASANDWESVDVTLD